MYALPLAVCEQKILALGAGRNQTLASGAEIEPERRWRGGGERPEDRPGGEARDIRAEERDRLAELRDAAAETRDAAAADDASPRAGEERKLAAQDRVAAARDRRLSRVDRLRAAGD